MLSSLGSWHLLESPIILLLHQLHRNRLLCSLLCRIQILHHLLTPWPWRAAENHLRIKIDPNHLFQLFVSVSGVVQSRIIARRSTIYIWRLCNFFNLHLRYLKSRNKCKDGSFFSQRCCKSRITIRYALLLDLIKINSLQNYCGFLVWTPMVIKIWSHLPYVHEWWITIVAIDFSVYLESWLIAKMWYLIFKSSLGVLMVILLLYVHLPIVIFLN